jgi:RimJ/RimL family protein N-acetyltransferase
VFPHNERAQKAYDALGFRFEERAKSPETGVSNSLKMVLQRSHWGSSRGSA